MQSRSGGSYQLRRGKPERVAHSGSPADEKPEPKAGTDKKQKESRDADEKAPAAGSA